MTAKRTPDRELRLVESAVAGSEEAWQQFIVRYSGLIYSLICRYLPHPDEDARRSVYVEILESLHGGALARFDGRASLATWIGVVTRSRCMDHLRHELGRRKEPVWLKDFSEDERELYRLYYVEGCSLGQIRETQIGNGSRWSVERMMETLDRIEDKLDRTTRRKLAFELQARTVGSVSGRLLEYLAYARQEAEEAKSAHGTDLGALEDEARRLMDRMDAALSKLEAEERDVIQLRYYEGQTAEMVAQRASLDSPRRVYTIADRALRKLREILEAQEAQEASA